MSDNKGKFIVLSEQRTGSNLFLSGLDQHPQVQSFHEALNKKYQRLGLFASEKEEKERIDTLRREDPKSFLMDYLFDHTRHEADWLGFKCQYQDLRGRHTSDVVEALQAQDGLLVFHLVRDNMLDRLLSKLNAERTGQYWVKNGSNQSKHPDPYELPFDDAAKDFALYAKEQARVEAFFTGMQVVRVTYEDITSDYSTGVNSCLARMSLDPVEIAPRSEKQSLPARQQLSNFEELRLAFEGTDYQRFFA